MRPVERGDSPRASWSDYNDARPLLEKALGDYCSYCEIPNATDVEHKLPKEAHPALELAWDNFLLSCKSCNSIKHHRQSPGSGMAPDAALALYLWPDVDNTARAFVYHPHNNDVTVAPGLPMDVAGAAAATLAMTGIDRIPGKSPGPTPKDKRWTRRREAWNIAEEWSRTLSMSNTLDLRSCIADLASKTGFWSVWRVVFQRDPDMLRRIDHAFLGTASDCFDPTTRELVARPNRKL